MCGISGIYEFGGGGPAGAPGKVREADLTAMRETLTHRGPVSGSNYISPSGVAGLSQRRLAIIDLSPRGQLPHGE